MLLFILRCCLSGHRSDGFIQKRIGEGVCGEGFIGVRRQIPQADLAVTVERHDVPAAGFQRIAVLTLQFGTGEIIEDFILRQLMAQCVSQ